MPDRRFPPPWTVEDHNDACFIVKEGSQRGENEADEAGERPPAPPPNDG